MSEQPDLLTLPKRMRYAASVLLETTHSLSEIHTKSNADPESEPWTCRELVAHAHEIEIGQEAAELAEVLTRERKLWPGGDFLIARHLIEWGWRKAESDE